MVESLQFFHRARIWYFTAKSYHHHIRLPDTLWRVLSRFEQLLPNNSGTTQPLLSNGAVNNQAMPLMKTEPAKENRLHESTNFVFVGVIMILILSHNTGWGGLHYSQPWQHSDCFGRSSRRKRKGGKKMIFSFWRFAKGCPWSLDTILMHCTPLSDTGPAESQHIGQKRRMS